jgi:flagellin
MIVNTTINGAQAQVSNGAVINGNIMLSWNSRQRYSSSYDVWAQILSTTEQITTTTLTNTSYTTAVISIPSSSSLVDLTTFSAAQSSLTLIDGALAKAIGNRAGLGAVMGTVAYAADANQNAVTNLTQSRSRIEDTDYGQQIAALTKSQIIQQASMAMLAQANASKQSILMLLKSAA